MSSDMRVRAFAKINRSLRVLGTRADGYHELRTIFQSIALHDTLTIRAGPRAVPADLRRSGLSDRRHQSDRARRRGDVERGRTPGRAARRGDRSPQAHSDAGRPGRRQQRRGRRAAGAREAVAGRPTRRCGAAAAALGADVPYFLEGGTVLGLERGDLLFPLLDRRRAWVVLVLPGLRRQHEGGVRLVRRVSCVGSADRGGGRRRTSPLQEPVNDLEAPVVARHPEIGRIISALRRAGASQAAMSGSGSAVFGLFSSRAGGARAAKRAGRPPGARW